MWGSSTHCSYLFIVLSLFLELLLDICMITLPCVPRWPQAACHTADHTFCMKSRSLLIWQLQGLRWSQGEGMVLSVKELWNLWFLWRLWFFWDPQISLLWFFSNSSILETVESMENIDLRLRSSGFSFCFFFCVLTTTQLRTLKKTLSIPLCDLEDK